MPTDSPSDPAPSWRPATPRGPTITATIGQVVVDGTGFLPNHVVTIRITRGGDGSADYLTYTTDTEGRLTAVLPLTAIAQTAQISASDHRPVADDDNGLLWSNTIIVTGSEP
jgi:hypothetical protein